MRALALIATVALLLPGCFVVGALGGAVAAHSNNSDIKDRRAKGEDVPDDEEWSETAGVVVGGALGAVVDLALIELSMGGILRSE